MRLRRLYLGDYRVVRDLDIRFGPPETDGVPPTHDTSYSLDFLVGVNSTGKSTVLRAIADLVRKLERQAPIPFLFELEYDLGPPEHRRQINSRTCLTSCRTRWLLETLHDSGWTIRQSRSVAMSSRHWLWRSQLAVKTSGDASTRQGHSALGILAPFGSCHPVSRHCENSPGDHRVQKPWKNSKPLKNVAFSSCRLVERFVSS